MHFSYIEIFIGISCFLTLILFPLLPPRMFKGLQAPNVSIYIDDARSHLLASEKKYDLIISEPSNPWISGIGNLFAKEFYEASSAKLNPGGTSCQWEQLYRMRAEEVKMIFKTFCSVFPEVTVWHVNPADILLIGSSKGLEVLSYDAVLKKMTGSMSNDLKAYLSIFDPLDFFPATSPVRRD